MRLAREAVISATTDDARPLVGSSPATSAIALRAAPPESRLFSTSEQRLLEEWLDRPAADVAPASS